jgi:hypothetical protein
MPSAGEEVRRAQVLAGDRVGVAEEEAEKADARERREHSPGPGAGADVEDGAAVGVRLTELAHHALGHREVQLSTRRTPREEEEVLLTS